MESAFRDPELKLIETFGWNGGAFVRLGLHRARMRASAAALSFPFDPAGFAAVLPADPGPAPLRLRLTLDRRGRFDLASAPLAAPPALWQLEIAPQRMASADPRLAHKTTDRAAYDLARASLPDGADEMIFLNERDEVTEGSITSLFFDRGEGLKTPPLASGCLPGCLRAEMIASGAVTESVLAAAELPHVRLWVGNSLRGLISARLR